MKPEGTPREGRLDSIRGIAALAVAGGHCVTARSLEPQYARTIADLDYDSLTAVVLRALHIVFNAEAAILVFFVLSGFVLATSLRRVQQRFGAEFAGFAIKRVYRILPAVIVSFVPLMFFIDRSALEYVRNMLLLQATINGVTWTLPVELAGSLLVFLTVLLTKRARWVLIPLLIVLVILFLSDYEWIFFRHLPAFFVGCFVGEIRKHLRAHDALVVVGVMLLATADFFFGYGTKATVAVETVGAVLLIAAAGESRMLRFLDARPFLFLGRISYSFYLYHLLGALLSVKLFELVGFSLWSLHPVPSALVYMAVSIPIAIVLATASYYLVEQPCIAAGAGLARTVRDRLARIGSREEPVAAEPEDAPRTTG